MRYQTPLPIQYAAPHVRAKAMAVNAVSIGIFTVYI